MSSIANGFISSTLSDHSLFVDADGTLWACGLNQWGQLGLGDEESRTKVAKVSTVPNISCISSGFSHSVYLTTDGRVWIFGALRNSFSSSNSTYTYKEIKIHEPQELCMSNKIVHVSSGWCHVVFVDDQGFVWSCGEKKEGQLGYGETRDIPAQIPELRNIVHVACGGYHTICLDSQDTLWSFGKNNKGQLGIGDRDDRYQPVEIQGFHHSIIQISLGFEHSVLLDAQGSVWSFGQNDYEQLGHGDLEDRSEPTCIVEVEKIQQISCGRYHTVMLDTECNVWFCGTIDGIRDNDTPKRIKYLENIVHISSGNDHVICLNSEGTFFSFGNNSNGELGIGNYKPKKKPKEIPGIKGDVNRYRRTNQEQ